MEMGFRVKSGVLIPSGITSTHWVIITPGTIDFFLILTVIKRVQQNLKVKIPTLDLFNLIISILTVNLPCPGAVGSSSLAFRILNILQQKRLCQLRKTKNKTLKNMLRIVMMHDSEDE